jgi:transposase
MFFPEGRVRVFVHGRPVDMRKSFTGLIALTKQALGADPLSGHLFVFVNRRGDYLKALYWDRSGFCVWAKRLERGRFVANWHQVGDRELDVTGLKLLLEGIEPAHQRLRYQHRPTPLNEPGRIAPCP